MLSPLPIAIAGKRGSPESSNGSRHKVAGKADRTKLDIHGGYRSCFHDQGAGNQPAHQPREQQEKESFHVVSPKR